MIYLIFQSFLALSIMGIIAFACGWLYRHLLNKSQNKENDQNQISFDLAYKIKNDIYKEEPWNNIKNNNHLSSINDLERKIIRIEGKLAQQSSNNPEEFLELKNNFFQLKNKIQEREEIINKWDKKFWEVLTDKEFLENKYKQLVEKNNFIELELKNNKEMIKKFENQIFDICQNEQIQNILQNEEDLRMQIDLIKSKMDLKDLKIREIEKNIFKLSQNNNNSFELNGIKKTLSTLLQNIHHNEEKIIEIENEIKNNFYENITTMPYSKDDLTQISGIGLFIEQKLYEYGITTFEQIAKLSKDDIETLSKEIYFNGRILRDKWIPQAEKILVDRKSSKAS